MKRLRKLLRQPESQIFIFLVSLILANWPFLAPPLDGLMSLFTYLFVLWIVFVLFLFLLHFALNGNAGDQTADKGEND